jgi:O-antigen/teichoic acid export membrane protein
MGIEAFGLVGIFITLQSIFVVFDIGISVTLNREIARLSIVGGNAENQRDLVFTLQVIYWLIALLIGVIVFALAPFIARHWVNLQSLSVETARTCIRLIGVAMALQFPFAFYQSGLVGLQRQILLNVVMVALATMRGVGILLALWLILPAPEIFFAGQIVISTVGTGAVAILLWRCLPVSREHSSSFRFDQIRRVWRFSIAYSANSVAQLGLLQGDKIILSTLLPLKMFGYYVLAQSITSGLYAIIIAINGAIFPQFAGLIALGREAELSAMYHRGCQLMSVILMPVAVMVAIFSREVLMLWTGDAVIVENVQLLLRLLVTGMLLHGLIHLPYYLQIAYGWWRLISITNIFLLLTITPLNIIMSKSFGGLGAAMVWILLNVCFMSTVPVMHRRFLRGQLGRWFFHDVCLPLGGVIIISGLAYWLTPKHLSRIEMLAYLSTAGLLAVVAATAFASQLRNSVLAYLRQQA